MEHEGQEIRPTATSNVIVDELRLMADEQYRLFNAKLVPTVSAETMVGVRVPQLRAYAKRLIHTDAADGASQAQAFMADLPHTLFEENMLHALLIGQTARTAVEAFDMLDRFLPFVDNWAVCDAISVRAFHAKSTDTDMIIRRLTEWTTSDHPYVVRFAVDTLMKEFLDDPRFQPEQLKLVLSIRSAEYYVNMARAWYFATALIKQWNTAITVFLPDAPADLRLDEWTHNKSIQKARESRRIDSEQKAYLATLKR